MEEIELGSSSWAGVMHSHPEHPKWPWRGSVLPSKKGGGQTAPITWFPVKYDCDFCCCCLEIPFIWNEFSDWFCIISLKLSWIPQRKLCGHPAVFWPTIFSVNFFWERITWVWLDHLVSSNTELQHTNTESTVLQPNPLLMGRGREWNRSSKAAVRGGSSDDGMYQILPPLSAVLSHWTCTSHRAIIGPEILMAEGSLQGGKDI